MFGLSINFENRIPMEFAADQRTVNNFWENTPRRERERLEMRRFQELHTVEMRRKNAQDAMRNNPGLVPVFPEPMSESIWMGSRLKFLCSREATVSKFVECLRKRIATIRAHESLTVMTTSGTMVPFTMKMGELYDRYHHREDLYLYLIFTVESTFGG